MKIFSLFDFRMPEPHELRTGPLAEDASWTRDPLSHPEIEHMSERELADLPFRMTAQPTLLECCRSP